MYYNGENFIDRQCRGYTLLEVVVTLAVLSIGLAVISRLMSTSLMQTVVTEEETEIQIICTNTLNRILCGELPIGKTQTLSVDGFPDWSIEVSAVRGRIPDITEVWLLAQKYETVSNVANVAGANVLDASSVPTGLDATEMTGLAAPFEASTGLPGSQSPDFTGMNGSDASGMTNISGSRRQPVSGRRIFLKQWVLTSMIRLTEDPLATAPDYSGSQEQVSEAMLAEAKIGDGTLGVGTRATDQDSAQSQGEFQNSVAQPGTGSAFGGSSLQSPGVSFQGSGSSLNSGVSFPSIGGGSSGNAANLPASNGFVSDTSLEDGMFPSGVSPGTQEQGN